MRRKYAGRRIDVVISTSSVPLAFLRKFGAQLFPHTPIVFANEQPVDSHIQAQFDATGIIYVNSYARTVDLALQLHPETQRLFVISGTLSHDRAFEIIARDALKDYENRVSVTYLTDLSPGRLAATLRNLPDRSVVLHVRQQFRSETGELWESQRILTAIAPSSRAPIFGMSFLNVGLGIVGGYVWTLEANAVKLAEIAMRVTNGEKAASIPIENAPETPMFDWRQLQRWQVREERLPPGSVIRFHELTLWQRYKWRIVAAVLLFVFQASLIAALLIGRRRMRRTQLELQDYKEHLELLVQDRTAALVEARDQALAANRAKSVFLANMSHELRTPLNAILGFSSMVLRDTGLSEQHRKDLVLVGASGEHLLSLIDDVLDMAKIETDSVVVESAPLDLHALARETVSLMRERAQARNLDLSLDISSRTPVLILSDAAKLRQVMTNLVGNALKYTDQGGVVIRIDATPRGCPPQVTLSFDVEDTGIGIAPEDHARIFDPFVQVAGLRNRQGAGLGLSISRRFVEALGGTIQVESAPGKGSRFHVALPAITAEAPAPHPDNAFARVIGLEPGQPEYRILIVEDQRENWLLLQRLLETAGFAVRVSEDGLQAVEAFESWRPCFIWMDLRLPVMSGMEATKRIRALEGGHEVKIAAVTASVFASQREEVLTAGFDDFLRKPYRPNEVFDCMARHLDLRYRRESRTEPPAVETPSTLRPEDLAALPAGIRGELEDAVIALDHKRISALVRRIGEQNAPLGRLLARFSNQLAYTPIFEALERSKG